MHSNQTPGVTINNLHAQSKKMGVGPVAAIAVLALLVLVLVVSPPQLSSAVPSSSCPRATPPEKLTPTQAVDAETLQRLALEFMQHCSRRHPTDKRVTRLVGTWNRTVLQSDFPGDPRTVWGTFNKATGCLMMRMDRAKSMEEQLAIMLHELAHTSGQGHDDVWKEAYLFFLGVATQEMGWKVTLKCPTVCKSHAICARSNCPSCDWTPSFEHCIR